MAELSEMESDDLLQREEAPVPARRRETISIAQTEVPQTTAMTYLETPNKRPLCGNIQYGVIGHFYFQELFME